MYRFILISLVLIIGGLIAYDSKRPIKPIPPQAGKTNTQMQTATQGSEDITEGDDALIPPQNKSHKSL